MNLFIRWVWLLFSTSVITIYSTAFLAQNAITQNALMIVSIYVIFFLQNPTHPDPACQCNISVILDCTECHAYISYDFTWVWRHLLTFHIIMRRTIYHQFHYLYSCTLSSLHIYSYSYLTQDNTSLHVSNLHVYKD